MCGLAQILVDPYYRTLHGFQALIGKEWLSFGHKFTDGCGHIQVDHKESSPVLTQWLECVWHLSQQFPFVFQFNDRLLLGIHDHVHSCQFGTFVGNCQKDRIDLRYFSFAFSQITHDSWKLRNQDDYELVIFIPTLYLYRVEEKTYSLWGYIANHMNEYLNPLYRPDYNIGFIQPNLAPQTYK